jgi:hypothetical protein
MLPGCAIGVVLGVVSALSDAGQLVCKADTAYKAMYDTQGDAILAQGATATAVSDVCALVGGTPAPLPAATVPTNTAVTLPPTIAVPLKPITTAAD